MAHGIQHVLEWVCQRARNRPDEIAFTFLPRGEGEEVRWTYARLHRDASVIARALQTTVPPGSRVLLVYPAGVEFMAALFGCFYAGVIAVPAYPPRPNQSSKALEAIAADSGSTLALTTPRLLASLANRSADGVLSTLRWLAPESVGDNDYEPLRPPPDTVAYLQYTSGSTGTPKGVMVTFGNIVNNSAMITAALGLSDRSIIVGWLPLFHDMGLVGIAFQSLALGVHCVLLPPIYFLQKPLRWLHAISRYQATMSGGPNFAYERCVRTARREDLEALDLRSWSVAFNGAEPVRAGTLAAFTSTFAPCGFAERSFYPAYGLAEATLFATAADPTDAPIVKTFDAASLTAGRVADAVAGQTSVTLVSCGRPRGGHRIAIVDPETNRLCPDGQVGEIWFSGASVAAGYWHRPEDTGATFAARIAGVDAAFLRTGDLGFVDDQQLYIAGRLKDMIIVRGANYYAQDIEATVQRASPVFPIDACAAFVVEIDGDERLVVVQESPRRRGPVVDWQSAIAAVRERVAAEHGIQAHAVIVVEPGVVPRTTSGKIRRSACRDLLREHLLDVVAADYGEPDCRVGRSR